MSTGDVRAPRREETLEPTEIHDVLRNDRRRLVIERLRETGEQEAVRDLAEHIASIESGEVPAPRNVRQSVYVSLHQTHLPKLDGLGIISYDSDGKEVALASNVDEVAVYLEIVPKYGLSWGEYYLGVSLFGLLALTGEAMGLPGLTALGPTYLGAGILLVIMSSATFQVINQRSTLLHRLRESAESFD